MARDAAMPAFAGRLAERTGAPVAAIALQAVLAVLLVLLGTFETIVAYFIFVTVCFLGLTVSGVYVLRRRAGPGAARTFSAAPAVFLSSVSLVLGLMLAGRPRESLLGVAVVALGIPVYRRFLWRTNP
jgi:APA family basic amino acid/polyamine antiporter